MSFNKKYKILFGFFLVCAVLLGSSVWASRHLLQLCTYEVCLDYSGAAETAKSAGTSRAAGASGAAEVPGAAGTSGSTEALGSAEVSNLTGTSESEDTDRMDDNPEISLRIIQLSDLHNRVFGRDNQKLTEKIRAQKPDLIFMTGDMVNQEEESTEVIVSLVQKLSEIAPVYYSYGNHEAVHEQNWNTNFRQLIKKAGAVVLERNYVDTDVKGLSVRIGGIYGYCLPDMESGEDFEEETEFLQEFENTDRCKILLCHMPVCWMINGSLDYWNIDLVFAGHAHGGQVVLPFAGGLYAPDMEWFPGRLDGVFDSEDGRHHLILSRGLGSEGIVPRINNLPEILQVDVQFTVQTVPVHLAAQVRENVIQVEQALLRSKI